MPNIITIATKALQEAIQSGVNTLTDRLTANRAGNLDKIDTPISSRASQTSVNNISSVMNRVDWSSKTPGYFFSNYNPPTGEGFITVGEVIGSGFILNIAVNVSSSHYYNTKILIDNNLIVETEGGVGDGSTVIWRFENSFKILGERTSSSGSFFNVRYTYVLD